jgi:hypothetical protein
MVTSVGLTGMAACPEPKMPAVLLPIGSQVSHTLDTLVNHLAIRYL